MTSLPPIPILIPTFPHQKSQSLPEEWELRLSCLLFRLVIYPVPETRIRKMSWKPWKTRTGGRTAEVSELGERKFYPLSISKAALIIKCSRIWEKKYGKGAKHVVKQREEETEKKRVKEEKGRQREAAAKRPHWATKRVFEPPRQTDSGYGGRIAAKTGGGDKRVGGQPPLKKPRREDKALHPSWEAKKRMKEKESAAIIPSAGNKIVF